nr:retrovirus-related Pol polyprotein from transposon TNT 1-94 [Tanacetum cinerariifolium]
MWEAIERHKGKEIAKPVTPPSETASEEDSDPKQAQRDKDMQKNLSLIAKYLKKIYKPTNNNLRTSSNSKNKNVDMTSRKPKRVKDSAYHKEKMLMCKQAEQGVPLQAEQYDWLADTDEEVNEQELEAHYSYMAKIQEVPITDSGTDSEPVEQNEQNDVESDDERVALANLIANLKLDTKQAKFEKYKAFNDRSIDYDKLERKLNEALGQLAQKDNVIREEIVDNAWIKHLKDQFHTPTAQDMEILIQTCLMPLGIKTQNYSFKFVHELKQEMHDDLNYVESLEKEINELESDKAEFSDMYDVILQECVSKDVMCSYLQSLSDLDALAKLQCMYLHKVKECDCLAQKLSKQTESVSKKVHTEILQRSAKVEKHSISLDIALQKCKEQEMSRSTGFITSNSSITISSQLVNFVMRIWRLLSGSQHVLLEIFRATPTQARLWHQRLSHLNFDYINLLSKKDTVIGLLKLKYVKDQLYSSCELSKAKRSSFKSKAFSSSKGRLNLLHMDLCGQMRVASINEKKYILEMPRSTGFITSNSSITISSQLVNFVMRIWRLLSGSQHVLLEIFRATPAQAWLWHQRLSHLNFDYINLLSKKDTVIGLPKLKYVKDQLYSSCELSKAKRSSFKSKAFPSSKGRLNLLHMDLCGQMRNASC